MIVAIKTKTKLIKALKEQYNITYYKKPSFFASFFKSTPKVDLYIHKGILNDEARELIATSSYTIVNAKQVKQNILQSMQFIQSDKIISLYPYINATLSYTTNLKQQLKQQLDIDQENLVVFTRVKNFKRDGFEYLLNIIKNTNNKQLTFVIETKKEFASQIANLIKSVEFQVILLEDYKNIDELFVVSDIFVYPTLYKYIVPDVLKAMHYCNAVFLSKNNHTAELLDYFSLIQDWEDENLVFKINSLLANSKELSKIQTTNSSKVSQLTFENRLEKLSLIAQKITQNRS
jgi:hypothetical protein